MEGVKSYLLLQSDLLHPPFRKARCTACNIVTYNHWGQIVVKHTVQQYWEWELSSTQKKTSEIFLEIQLNTN